MDYTIAPSDLYQTRIYAELLNQIPHRTLFEVLTSTHTPQHTTHCGMASSLGWTTYTFETDPRHYRRLCQQHRNPRVHPIYTYLGLRPSLDHMILMLQKPLGILRIDHERILDLFEGLHYCLSHQLIDCLILHVIPRCQPTNRWLEILLNLQTCGYQIYDLSTPQITTETNSIQLIPWDLDQIHVTNEVTLLCRI